MRIAHSHLKTAASLVVSYQKGKPLVHHLKSFFAQNKKMGSRDRKIVSRLCYAYFRCFNCLNSITQTEEKIIASLFLTQQEADPVLAELKPEWNSLYQLPPAAKCSLLGLDSSSFFGFANLLSSSIDELAFSESLLVQPDLFLRIRPGRLQAVTNKLNAAGLSFEVMGNALRLNNGTQVDKILELDKEVVIQDLSTQKAFDRLDLKMLPTEEVAVWDCCAASGGKSILMSDLLGMRMRLTATDIRKSILANMKERLQRAGVNLHRSFNVDLTVQSGMSETDQFDMVIADVPCTGSGTWARTPEQHYSFQESELIHFIDKQKGIIHNVVPHLNKGGILVYLTCSAFHAENEKQVSYFADNYDMKIIDKHYHNGTSIKSDTLYSAILKKQ